MANDGWKTMTYKNYNGDFDPDLPKDQVVFVSYREVDGLPIDLNCDYDFFDTEREAATLFLETIAANPACGYRGIEYRDAKKATAKI